jgi:hypothetical protein
MNNPNAKIALQCPDNRAFFICPLYDWANFLSPFYGGRLRLQHLRGDMNQLDSRPPTLTYPIASHSETHPTRRLIVLFPASEPDSPDLAHRIWEIARSLQTNVLLLSLTNDFDEEARLRRNLITMAAVIKDSNISTEILIEYGSDWVGQVKKIWRAGDIVACYEGQKVGFMHKSLDQVLRSNLESPIYLLSGYQPTTNPNSTYWSRVASWSGSLAIIGGFLWAEMKIVQLPQDWAHTVLVYISIFVEIALILLWNSLFS